MLPSSHRLPAFRIPLVLRNGKRKHHELFQIAFTDSRNYGQHAEENSGNLNKISRFSFVVSTKIDKRATRRNRMRRVLSESVRHILSDMPKGNDYVFVVKKNFSDMEQTDIESIVRKMIS